MIPVDTSARVEFGRGTDSPVCKAVVRLLDDDLATCDAVSMGLFAGARDEQQLAKQGGLLARTAVLPTPPAHDALAATLCRACRTRGKTVRKLIDCLIGALTPDLGSIRIRAGYVDPRRWSDNEPWRSDRPAVLRLHAPDPVG